ncbi:hypothetical protein [Clostridium lundense]|uniref:hypothetical protein n=1 Tax=Clostridium lundense TaxID=319475 RepID=UPI000489BB76|nr:hypothetical protein [Clostridium lundense]
MKKNRVIIILMLIIFLSLLTVSFFKKRTIAKYQSYDLALEAALSAKLGKLSDKENSIKILEKNIEDKSIIFFKRKVLDGDNKLTDTMFIVEIDKKDNQYTYNAKPDISLEYKGEVEDVPYLLIEDVVKINENKKLYYGVGKILDKSYKLVAKNYKNINIIEDNIFIIADEEKYEKIEFKKSNLRI